MENKSNWPQWKKEQFNQVIRKRNEEKVLQARKDRVLDERLCPELWKLPLNEDVLFSMLAYVFPFNQVISRILQRFYRPENRKLLLVSARYLYNTRSIFPGYYSDRERIVVMLNRYKATEDLNEFINWLPFHSDRSSAHLIHLMIGVFYLDQYLNSLSKQLLLTVAISHLEKAKRSFKTRDAHLAFSSLIAFGYYMNNDFEESIENLDERDQNEFQADFGALIKKVA